MVQGLDNHFTHSFGCAHDIGRIYCFVGRDQHKFLYLAAPCRTCCFVSTKHIVFDCLIRAVLHQWHMLMCCRMKDDFRMVCLHHCIDTVCISHGSDQYRKLQFGMFPLQLLLDLICIIFIDIEDHQMSDPVFCQLGTDLAADGSAASGYENGFSFDIAKDFVQIDFDRLSAQQIFDFHISQF